MAGIVDTVDSDGASSGRFSGNPFADDRRSSTPSRFGVPQNPFGDDHQSSVLTRSVRSSGVSPSSDASVHFELPDWHRRNHTQRVKTEPSTSDAPGDDEGDSQSPATGSPTEATRIGHKLRARSPAGSDGADQNTVISCEKCRGDIDPSQALSCPWFDEDPISHRSWVILHREKTSGF